VHLCCKCCELYWWMEQDDGLPLCCGLPICSPGRLTKRLFTLTVALQVTVA
jgi:hypothetical protein